MEYKFPAARPDAVSRVIDILSGGAFVKSLPMSVKTTNSTVRLKGDGSFKLYDVFADGTRVEVELKCDAPIDKVPTLPCGETLVKPVAPVVTTPPAPETREKTVEEMSPLERINAGYAPKNVDGKVTWVKQ